MDGRGEVDMGVETHSEKTIVGGDQAHSTAWREGRNYNGG